MSRPILCDACGQQCDPLQVVQVTGWWTKHLKRKGEGKGKKAMDDFEPIQRSDTETLMTDICGNCMASKFPSIQLHQIPTRNHQIKESIAAGASPFKALRENMGFIVDSVRCDICEAECYENHLRFKGVGTEDHEFTAEVCATCTETHLSDVKFERKPPVANPLLA